MITSDDGSSIDSISPRQQNENDDDDDSSVDSLDNAMAMGNELQESDLYLIDESGGIHPKRLNACEKKLWTRIQHGSIDSQRSKQSSL